LSYLSTKYQSPNPKIAIVHDWLVGGGAERVVMALHEMFPNAPIYTAYCNESSKKAFAKADIKTSYMQNFPFSKLRKFLPILRQRWFEKLDLTDYDLILSSSGSEAKGINNLRPGALHINYCHSPTHYYWVRYDEYLKNPGFGIFDPIARLGLKLLLKPARKWDLKASERPNIIIANSEAVKQRIKQFYKRDSIVIHPPVDVGKFNVKNFDRHGFVVAARLTPYKRVDLAVRACSIGNIDLTVIGDGPDMNRLKAMAGPTVRFAGYVADSDIADYFSKSRAFIFPNEDDFGITPVEAMACGTPVIAYKKGGALDYVIEGKTGVFFDKQTPEALLKAIKNFEEKQFDSKDVRCAAEKFSAEVFKQKINKLIDEAQTN
jgi:glycosyltransferase involved in cell wall biosynthesis